ncbi:DUF3558 domain-containing protein [Kibdelosporangium persicum]|uniref:DUF3558 domain-containing protein n=1 Tax=Kibdelosporangium persicum TaxID=2698649 RepID=UPI00156657DC|nr:DUF3558 domain-containing protein [Kibdelosporangium persicum]
MRHSLHGFALTVIGLTLLGTGCTVTQDGSPRSTAKPTSETTRPGPANRYGAPSVSNPLDATKFLTQPCAALSTTQLTSLNLTAQGEADTTSAIARNVGPGCIWQNSSTAYTLGLTFMVGNKNGLADFYRGHQDGRFKGYWIETTVDDYPAVYENSTDNRKTGECDLAIGISDTLTFRTRVQSRDGEKSCDQTKQAASLILQTLKTGG